MALKDRGRWRSFPKTQEKKKKKLRTSKRIAIGQRTDARLLHRDHDLKVPPPQKTVHLRCGWLVSCCCGCDSLRGWHSRFWDFQLRDHFIADDDGHDLKSHCIVRVEFWRSVTPVDHRQQHYRFFGRLNLNNKDCQAYRHIQLRKAVANCPQIVSSNLEPTIIHQLRPGQIRLYKCTDALICRRQNHIWIKKKMNRIFPLNFREEDSPWLTCFSTLSHMLVVSPAFSSSSCLMLIGVWSNGKKSFLLILSRSSNSILLSYRSRLNENTSFLSTLSTVNSFSFQWILSECAPC